MLSRFDQLYLRRDPDGRVVEFNIVEVKTGDAELGSGAETGDQMTQEWVRNVAKHLADSSNAEGRRVGSDVLRALREGHPKVTGRVLRTDQSGKNPVEAPCPEGGKYN